LAGSETAVTNITPGEIAKMQRRKEKNIDYLVKSQRNLDRTLVSILIANNIVNIVLSSVAAVVANDLFQAVGVTIMVAIVTILIIVFGEIIPKSNAIWDTKKVARKNSKPIYYLTKAFSPLITFFIGISRGIFRLTGKKISKKNLLVTDESIKDIASLGEAEGIIKKIEKEIIHNVFVFGDKKIEEIMVPMDKVFFIDNKYNISDAKKSVAKRGFTRVPVVNETNKVIGVLYCKDLIDTEAGSIDPLIRSPFIVSAKNDITDIFNVMKQKKVHLAIVEDDQGKQIGIVTMEDILEELVGEIHDEYYEAKYRSASNNAINGKSTSIN
jgi:CBS domain containing-hemolysin-like protein